MCLNNICYNIDIVCFVQIILSKAENIGNSVLAIIHHETVNVLINHYFITEYIEDRAKRKYSV